MKAAQEKLNKCVLYGRKFWPGIKFGDLAVRVETTKLKSAIIVCTYATRNNVVHVTRPAPLYAAVHVASRR